MILIALGGYSHTGKDEVGNILIERYHFTRVAKGDLIKQAALQINPRIGGGSSFRTDDRSLASLVRSLGWEEAKKLYPEVRSFLQNLPDAVVAVCGFDAWNDAVYRQIEREHLQTVVLTRICLRTEAEEVKKRGGDVWCVRRPGVGPVNDSANEHDLDDWPFDAYIDNDGTLLDLADRVASALGDRIS